MTGVERAKRTLNFEPTDRVPIYSHLRNPAAIERVTGMDFWADPWKATVRAYQVLEIDMVKAIAVPVKGKEQPGYKINPTLYGMYKLEPDLRSLEEVVEYAKKLPSEQELRRDYDFEGAARAYEKGWRRHQEAVGDSTLIIWAMGGCFDTNIDLMGYENLLSGFLLERTAISDIMRTKTARNRLYAEAIASKALSPAVMVCDDIAYSGALMVSPAIMREVFIPNLKYVIEPFKKAGIKVIFHSDGDLGEILDDLVEAGIDGLHPIEPKAGMSLRQVKEKYGRPNAERRLVLVGNVCCSTTLPMGTVENVEREVKECMEAGAPGGGYFIATSSMMGLDVPVENVLAFYDSAKRYGQAA